ncbi:MAG: hypothetical protein P0Y53_01300 [Candidatus Pseudobacter hemicellulosilyticus]|uniref:Uncharacterized protein n=1 Tax=Candidatus Pseudobacter hemicellulosilyticus TaxID=3121375 RepID=A0AAJ6BGE8_9BACT|nr:MAG: hypothetical protein P0Y53_01300 [Pseudobacter sp.]
MTIADIIQHPLDKLIGNTLICSFDLILAVRISKNQSGSLTAYQQQVWHQWIIQAARFKTGDKPEEIIDLVHELKWGQKNPIYLDQTADPYVQIHQKSFQLPEFAQHFKKALRLTIQFNRIRAKLAASKSISQEDLEIWHTYKYTAIPYSANPICYSFADISALYHLEINLRMSVFKTINWNSMPPEPLDPSADEP